MGKKKEELFGITDGRLQVRVNAELWAKIEEHQTKGGHETNGYSTGMEFNGRLDNGMDPTTSSYIRCICWAPNGEEPPSTWRRV